tara:strand:- start:2370 stop:2558 length:189 start_codon:yes stop_codon:yes gene_type:complete
MTWRFRLQINSIALADGSKVKMASKKGKKDSGSGTGIPPLVDDCIEQIRLRGKIYLVVLGLA